MTPKNVRKKKGGLFYAAIKYCESWENAVNEVGIKYDEIVGKPWTAEKILEEIKNLHPKEEDLSTKNIRKKYKSLHDAYRHFGSWAKSV